MDLKRLLGLRPRTETAEAIGAAIAGATAAHDAALAEIARIEAARPALLAGSTEAEIMAAEAALVAARAEAEQLAALVTGLQPRLAAAQHQQAVADLRKLVAAANEKNDKFVAFIRDEYAKHCIAIEDGMQLERDYLKLLEQVSEAWGAAPAAAEELGLKRELPYPAAAIYPAGGNTMETTTISGRVSLPAAAGAEGPGDGSAWRIWRRQPRAEAA